MEIHLCFLTYIHTDSPNRQLYIMEEERFRYNPSWIQCPISYILYWIIHEYNLIHPK